MALIGQRLRQLSVEGRGCDGIGSVCMLLRSSRSFEYVDGRGQKQWLDFDGSAVMINVNEEKRTAPLGRD